MIYLKFAVKCTQIKYATELPQMQSVRQLCTCSLGNPPSLTIFGNPYIFSKSFVTFVSFHLSAARKSGLNKVEVLYQNILNK